MNLSIFDHLEQADQKALEGEKASFYHAFEQIKDGRKAKGKRYPLALLLTLLLLGKMAGETTFEGIIDWIEERKSTLKKLLNWPKDFPVERTYRDALAKCDHQEIVKTIAQVILKAKAVEKCRQEPSRLLAEAWQEEEELIHLTSIKENTPAVLHDLQEFFEDEGIDRSEFQYAKQVNKGHGRLENVAKQMRHFCAKPHEALSWLLGDLSR